MRIQLLKVANFALGQRFLSTKTYKKVTHCIFDMDGLLLDTELVYKKMITQLCAQYGHKYTDELMMKILGGTEQRLSEILCKELNLPVAPTEFRDQLLKLGDTMLAGAPLLDDYLWLDDDGRGQNKVVCLGGGLRPVVEQCGLVDGTPASISSYLFTGAERLIRHLHKTKVPFALATSSSERSVHTKVAKEKELFNLFHHKVMGSSDPEVKFGKPHPDIFLVAAARFPDKPDPSKCLVFEDSPHGVTAGIDAGMQVVMVPDPHLDKRLTKHATIVLSTLAKFQPELFGLPAF